MESIPNIPSPGKEEETPAIPAEDEGIQNHSTEAVTIEVNKHVVTDQVDGVVSLAPTTPSSQKSPTQVFSTPESLKTTESPKDKLEDGDDHSTVKALDLTKLTLFCQTEAVNNNFWEHISKGAKDMKVR